MNDIADTKTRILDSAEKLFGLNGIEQTSLRDITAHAQVNLAAVNYHFQSKDSLVDSVIARRIEPVNRRRLELLDAAGPDATIEMEILTAFLTPALEIRLESVVPLLGRILSNPNLFVDRVYKRHFALISERFRAALGKALPDLTRRELLWRQMFMVGSMTHIMVLGQILPAVTEGVCDISDRAELLGYAWSVFSSPPASARPAKSQPDELRLGKRMAAKRRSNAPAHNRTGDHAGSAGAGRVRTSFGAGFGTSYRTSRDSEPEQSSRRKRRSARSNTLRGDHSGNA